MFVNCSIFFYIFGLDQTYQKIIVWTNSLLFQRQNSCSCLFAFCTKLLFTLKCYQCELATFIIYCSNSFLFCENNSSLAQTLFSSWETKLYSLTFPSRASLRDWPQKEFMWAIVSWCFLSLRWSNPIRICEKRSTFLDRFLAGSSTINSVECYNPDTHTWYEVSPMNLNRSAMSACVVAGLPNARGYSLVGRSGNALIQDAGSDTNLNWKWTKLKKTFRVDTFDLNISRDGSVQQVSKICVRTFCTINMSFFRQQ